MRKRTIDLGGRWSLCGFDGYGETLTSRELPQALENAVSIEAAVPGSVYLDLMRAGWIEDVYSQCNSLAAEWVERFLWFYRCSFTAPDVPPGRRCHLVLDGVDLDALIFLNGTPIGEHHNVFRPCRIDVTEGLRPGPNELIVRVDSGLLGAADKRGGAYNLELSALTTKRAHLRKPQFACRWDWSPRLMNVGIGYAAALEVCDTARLDQVMVTPRLDPAGGPAILRVRAIVENMTPTDQVVALHCRVLEVNGSSIAEAALPPGSSALVCELPIEHPRLWWPHTQGDQPLYTVEASLLVGTELVDTWSSRTGIRSVELRQEPAPDGGSLFHLVVNGEPIFCKGANWVPADLIHPRVLPEDYDALVALAVECGCNMLRVWGGGLYERHAFFEACDRAGVMVWHDLMFACSQYPGDDPEFRAEVEREVRHNVRELALHPSLLLWCGNNEIDLGVRDGWIAADRPGPQPCRALFLETFASLIRDEDPSRPYWPGSPWSPDGSHPNNPLCGDQHPWFVGLGEAKGDYWRYRDDAARFPNEGGVLGPSTMKTLRRILPESERFVGSRTWMHHDNTQNTWRGEPMLDNMLRLNLCPRPRDLSLEACVHYGGLLQGEALETAIDNWRRRKFDTAAAVFWMFNDTWPAVTSWTPIDYERRRKPAFWYVKRAFANLRALCVELGQELAIIVVNDFLHARRVAVRYGLFALAGGRPVDEQTEVPCPANAATIIARHPLAVWDELGVTTHGAFAIATDPADRRTPNEVTRPSSGQVAQPSSDGGAQPSSDGGAQPSADKIARRPSNQLAPLSSHRLFRARLRDLSWHTAPITCERVPGGLRLSSEHFAWAVCLDPDGESPLADNYFDLIPGIERILPWPDQTPPLTLLRPSNPPITPEPEPSQ